MIYLLRHSIDDNTKKGGWSDAILTPEGVELAKQTIAKIKQLNINKIVCSDLVRTRQTCEIINQELKLPVSFTSELREFNAGIVSGMAYDLADKLYPLPANAHKDMNFKYPNGETLGEFKNRVLKYFNNTIIHSDKVLYITHRNVISVIHNYLNKTEWNFIDKSTIKIPHCSLFKVDCQKDAIERI